MNVMHYRRKGNITLPAPVKNTLAKLIDPLSRRLAT
jgi:hypothetical protein